MKKGRKMKITGQAFGVGAYEEEDEDIYNRDDMSRYDFSLGNDGEYSFFLLKLNSMWTNYHTASRNNFLQNLTSPRFHSCNQFHTLRGSRHTRSP